MSQWDIDSAALKSADRHFAETLAAPDLRGLTDGLLPSPIRQAASITDPTSREVYAETIREIQDLLRDFRFCTGTALMLLFDAAKAQSDNPIEVPPSVPGLFLTEAELAVLLTNDDFVPPSALATDRHRHIGDGQTLGAWFGGLLLDTALLKCHGLLDRVTVALWCHAQLPITKTRAGQLKYPTFNKEWLKALAASYGTEPRWPTFLALVDAPLAKELVGYRHSATHQRRAGSAFNGSRERWHADEENPSSPMHKLTRGMTAIDHATAPLATYREIVSPALTIAAEMIRNHAPNS